MHKFHSNLFGMHPDFCCMDLQSVKKLWDKFTKSSNEGLSIAKFCQISITIANFLS